MGFIMDNLNFRGRPPEEQEELIRTTPAFQREPPAPTLDIPGVPSTARQGTGKSPGVIVLGKLFSAFCLTLLVLAGCAHVSEADRQEATIHYDLAVQNVVKNPPEAMKSVEKALSLNPASAEAWHVKGLLLHYSFQRLDEARAAYLKAMELKKPFPEARSDLGNLYMDEKRYDDAIAQYEAALGDMLYAAPFIAQTNMGWAYFKKGDSVQAINHLKAAITTNPQFCLAYLQLGQIYESQANGAEACKQYQRFRDHCPTSADANYRAGVCLQGEGKVAEAAKLLDACVADKLASDDQKDRCRQAKARLR